MNKEYIYLDNAATTPVRKEVLEAMLPYFTEHYGNASSMHQAGRSAKKALEEARIQIAKGIGATTEKEIFFTSGGTESDNWAVKAVAYANRKKGNHIITSLIEHHAVLHTCQYLESDGFEVTYLPVDANGLVNPEALRNSIKENTVLVSIMYANNEIGTIQPIKELVKIAKEKGICFHTDAVQAVGSIKINVAELGVDMLSLSGHKLGGPKGVGALYVKKGTKISSFMHGGAQEKGRRAGTENVTDVVGLGKAVEIATSDIESKSARLCSLRDKLIDNVMKNIPHVKLNGHREHRLCGNANFSFEFVEGESLVLKLDMSGVAASSGSACSSGSLDPSHVLMAIGLPHEIAHGSLRFSIGAQNTEEEIDKVLSILPKVVEDLRKMSPLYEEVKRGEMYV